MNNVLRNAFLLTVFISSFLLFAVQPMYAKIILPSFGGGSSVWTACMLFFQTVLLIGYFYSYLLSKVNSVAKQAKIHIGVALLSLMLMPFTYMLAQEPFNSVTSPFLMVFISLLFGIGLPYFVLSATAPLLQHWMGASHNKSQTYRLYSVSNIGAMLALFSYPFVIEINFSLAQQTLLWSGLYAVFAAAIGLSIWVVIKQGINTKTEAPFNESALSQISITSIIVWFLLSAVGVVLLVATTSKMTQNIPPIPFLWILPLALYLLTFILTFNNEKIYVRWYWLLTCVVTSNIALLLFFIGSQFGVATQITLYLVAMFVSTMICHGELAKTKPDTNKLTLFYLILAAGGCAGSVFASLIATHWFTQYYEFIVAYAAVFVLVVLSVKNGLVSTSTPPDSIEINVEKPRTIMVMAGISAIVFISFFAYLNKQFNQFNVFESRSFYGTLAVKDLQQLEVPERRLVDGYTAHGAQRLQLKDETDLEPLSYYRPESGIGILLNPSLWPDRKQVGLIGLGVGALAYYGQEGDSFIFYELNPDVALVANQYFDYLKSSQANIEVVLGDARVSMEQEVNSFGGHKFDVLIVDAFSSDAIPVHLLTAEAITLYKSQLVSDGSLAFHISNSYLNLKPVMRSIATQLDMQAIYFKSTPQNTLEHTTEWVVFTNNTRLINEASIQQIGDFDTLNLGLSIFWQDDYSSLVPLLK